MSVDPEEFRPRFEWLVPDGNDKLDPPLLIGKLRRGVESLPETQGTFTAGGLPGIGKQDEAAHVTRGMVVLAGSWPVPEYRNGGQRRVRRWVNPNYVHAHHYADAWARCECGALATRMINTEYDTPSEFHEDHADDCKTSWRFRCRADILEARERIAKEIAGYDLSVGEYHARFGVEPKTQGIHRKLIEGQNVSLREIRAEASVKRTNTECALLASGYSREEVASVWGITPDWLRQRVRKHGGYDITELESGPNLFSRPGAEAEA